MRYAAKANYTDPSIQMLLSHYIDMGVRRYEVYKEVSFLKFFKRWRHIGWTFATSPKYAIEQVKKDISDSIVTFEDGDR